MPNLPIAILGATSHIAKSLIGSFAAAETYDLHLFSRSEEKTTRFLSQEFPNRWATWTIHDNYKSFADTDYDAIINCVGVGTLRKLQGDFFRYFTVSEEFDNLVLDYLRKNHGNTLYISFSSGAVYGRNHSGPSEEGSCISLPVNHLPREDYYAVTRIYSEAKHRAFPDLRIVDLRLFSYFSRYIDLTDGYFMTELLNCLLHKKLFVTTTDNFVRDYLHPQDLFSLITACMQTDRINTAYDAVSASPTTKQAILDYFSQKHGLQYRQNESLRCESATGLKSVYCSRYNAASAIGYQPKYSSLEALQLESERLLSLRPGKGV